MSIRCVRFSLQTRVFSSHAQILNLTASGRPRLSKSDFAVALALTAFAQQKQGAFPLFNFPAVYDADIAQSSPSNKSSLTRPHYRYLVSPRLKPSTHDHARSPSSLLPLPIRGIRFVPVRSRPRHRPSTATEWRRLTILVRIGRMRPIPMGSATRERGRVRLNSLERLSWSERGRRSRSSWNRFTAAGSPNSRRTKSQGWCAVSVSLE